MFQISFKLMFDHIIRHIP